MKKKLLMRLLLILAVIAMVGGLVYKAFVQAMPDLIPLLKSGSEAEIEAYISTAGSVSGLICTALLQFLQVISVVLPGAPIQIAAGIVYGVLKGTAICYLSYLAANLIVFYVARRLGSTLEQLAPVKKADWQQKIRFLSGSDMPVYMTAMACIIPIVPNGIIPYAASKTKMTFKQFALAVSLGSLTPIFVMCLIGGRILAGEYILAVLVFVVSLGAVVLLTRYRVQVMTLVKRCTRSMHVFLFLMLAGR